MARRKLAELVTDTLKGKIAESKSAVVATSRAVAVRIKARCNIQGPVHGSMVDLGIDYTAAKRRSSIRRGKRHERARQAVQRRRRLAIIRAVVGDKARVVFTAGVGPSSAHDSPIWGLSDREVTSLRRTAATTMRPKARGRSLTMTSLVHGVPTARFEVAPILQYSRAVWMAVANREVAASRKCGLPDVASWWHEVMKDVAPLAAAYGEGGSSSITTDRKLAASAWRRIRGPIGAAVLSLKRIGWTFTSPFILRDDRGTELTLTHTTPALLKDQLVGGVKRDLERRMARKWAMTCLAYEGRRLCVDLAMAAIKPKQSVTPLARGAYRASLCDAIMTMSRAREGGYDVLDECPLCHKKGDTRFHRIYECDKSIEAVAAVVPRWFIEKARRGDHKDPFCVTGAFPHPSDISPPPPQSGIQIVWDNGPADGDNLQADAEENIGSKDFGGYVYIDGSCLQHVIADFTRAGSAVVMVDSVGRPRRRGLVPVPDHLPQTSQTSEGLALEVAMRSLTRETSMRGDCMSVVQAANAPVPRLVAARRKYGGLLMDILRDPARRRLAGNVLWVKAHKKLVGNEGAEEARDIRGNDAADKAAAEARKAHPQPSPEAQASIAYYTRRAPLVAKAAAAALPLYPPAPGNMPRAKKPENTKHAEEKAMHLWQFRAGAWRCAICASWARDEQSAKGARNQHCPGPHVSTNAAAFAALGHVLCRADGDMPFTFCAHCGGWAAKRCYLLKERCSPPTPAGRLALKRIAQGLHPWRKKLAEGGEAKRGSVCTAAAYDANQQRWKRRRTGGSSNTAATPQEDDNMGEVSMQDAEVREASGGDGPPAELARNNSEQEAPEATMVDAPVMNPLVRGTSMYTIVQTLLHTPARSGPAHIVPVFNGSTGRVITATIAELELERDWLRARGIHDDDPGEYEAAATSGTSRTLEDSCGGGVSSLSVAASGVRSPPAFGSRAQLLQHLRTQHDQAAEHRQEDPAPAPELGPPRLLPNLHRLHPHDRHGHVDRLPGPLGQQLHRDVRRRLHLGGGGGGGGGGAAAPALAPRNDGHRAGGDMAAQRIPGSGGDTPSSGDASVQPRLIGGGKDVHKLAKLDLVTAATQLATRDAGAKRPHRCQELARDTFGGQHPVDQPNEPTQRLPGSDGALPTSGPASVDPRWSQEQRRRRDILAPQPKDDFLFFSNGFDDLPPSIKRDLPEHEVDRRSRNVLGSDVSQPEAGELCVKPRPTGDEHGSKLTGSGAGSDVVAVHRPACVHSSGAAPSGEPRAEINIDCGTTTVLLDIAGAAPGKSTSEQRFRDGRRPDGLAQCCHGADLHRFRDEDGPQPKRRRIRGKSAPAEATPRSVRPPASTGPSGGAAAPARPLTPSLTRPAEGGVGLQRHRQPSTSRMTVSPSTPRAAASTGTSAGTSELASSEA